HRPAPLITRSRRPRPRPPRLPYTTLFRSLANKNRGITKVMPWGLVIALVAGLALAAPWGVDGDMNYMKLGIKLIVVVVVGALLGIGAGRQKRTGQAPAAIFWLVGILTLLNAAIAVLW